MSESVNIDRVIDHILVNIAPKFSQSDLKLIHDAMVKEFSKYSFEVKSTAIVPYDNKYVDWVKAYLATCKIDGLAERTIQQYAYRLRDFLDHLTKPLEEYTDMDFQYYLFDLQKRTGCGNRTLDTARGEVAAFFKWAHAKQYIERNPADAVRSIKYQKKPRVPLNDDELVRLQKACETPRDKLIVSLLYETGCRVSEVCHIRISDIDLEHKSIVVTGKGNKIRTVFFQAETKYLIQEYLKSRKDADSPYLFTGACHRTNADRPLTPATIERAVGRLAKAAGLKVHCTPHTLRHTYATDMLKRGGDITHIQKLLGHSSTDTTMIYANVNMDDCEADYRKRIS